jgi:hypothetical protein
MKLDGQSSEVQQPLVHTPPFAADPRMSGVPQNMPLLHWLFLLHEPPISTLAGSTHSRVIGSQTWGNLQVTAGQNVAGLTHFHVSR